MGGVPHFQAVYQGFVSNWSNGPVEGQIVINTLRGAKISTFTIQSGTESTIFNVNNLPSGTCIINYLSDKGNKAINFIKN